MTTVSKTKPLMVDANMYSVHVSFFEVNTSFYFRQMLKFPSVVALSFLLSSVPLHFMQPSNNVLSFDAHCAILTFNEKEL